jgi:predicted O-methyltransferase YrrM
VLKHKEPVDVLFLDADKEGYLDYLQKLLPRLRPGGLVIAHNMTEGMADPKFVKAITSDPNLETVFLNMSTSGIGVSVKKR